MTEMRIESWRGPTDQECEDFFAGGLQMNPKLQEIRDYVNWQVAAPSRWDYTARRIVADPGLYTHGLSYAMNCAKIDLEDALTLLSGWGTPEFKPEELYLAIRRAEDAVQDMIRNSTGHEDSDFVADVDRRHRPSG